MEVSSDLGRKPLGEAFGEQGGGEHQGRYRQPLFRIALSEVRPEAQVFVKVALGLTFRALINLFVAGKAWKRSAPWLQGISLRARSVALGDGHALQHRGSISTTAGRWWRLREIASSRCSASATTRQVCFEAELMRPACFGQRWTSTGPGHDRGGLRDYVAGGGW